MIDLRTLGAAGLRLADGSDARTVLSQPKRLALLAYLAVARPRGFHRRDTLLGLFWHESDEARARRALSQSVYVLRQALGKEVVVSRGGEEVGIAPGRLFCDVAAFEAALDAGRPAEALELYRGDLLPGFFLSDAPEFERWLDAERTRLRGRASAAAWSLADGAEAAGDARGAVRWARRAAELSPYDEGELRRLLALLDRTGDRAGAVQAYDAFARALAASLETEPSGETRALIAAIRARADLPPVVIPPPLPAPSPVRSAAPPLEAEPAEAGETDGAEAEAADASEAAAAPSPHPRAPSRRRGRLAAGVLAALALAGGVAAWYGRPAAAGPASPDRVAVLPFVVRGDQRIAYLREGMVDLLSTKLDGAGDLHTVDPHAVLGYLAAEGASGTAGGGVPEGRAVARRFGAGQFVLGTVVEAGGRLEVSAYLYEEGGRLKMRAGGVAHDEARLFDVVDELTRELLAGRMTAPDTRVARIAAVTTPSLPALKAYLQGEKDFRRGDFGAATDAFRGAVRYDTAFALAYYRLSSAADWAGMPEVAGPAAEHAMQHRDNLSALDRRLVEARWESWRGSAPRAEAMYRQVLATHPHDVEASFELAELLFHTGPWSGRPLGAAAPAFRRVLALQPGHLPSQVHLARIAALQGDAAGLDSLVRAVSAAEPGHERTIELRALRAALPRDPAGQDALVAEAARDGRWGVVNGAAERVALYTGDLAFAERLAAVLVPPGRETEARLAGLQTRAHLRAAQGRWRAAQEDLAALEALDPVLAAHTRAALVTMPFLAPSRAGLERARTALEKAEGGVPTLVGDARKYLEPRRLYHLGRIALRLEDPRAARAFARRLESWPAPGPEREFARSLGATLAAQADADAGDPAAALRALEAGWLPPRKELAISWPWSYAHASTRFFRARLLAGTGHDREALAWLAATREDIAGSPTLHAAVVLERARILDRQGKPGPAAAEYARFVDLWRGCDPELRPVLLAAERRLREIRGAKRG